MAIYSSNVHLQLPYGMRSDLRVDKLTSAGFEFRDYMGIWKLQRVVCEEFHLQTKFGCYYISHLEGAKFYNFSASWCRLGNGSA